MRMSVDDAKRCGAWGKVSPAVQKEILSKSQSKRVQEALANLESSGLASGKITMPARSDNPSKDPQTILFNALKDNLDGIEEEAKGLIPGRRFRADIYIPASKVTIEFDGWRHHALSQNGFKKGLERQNLFVRHGYKVLRYYAEQVFNDLDTVIAEILDVHEIGLAEQKMRLAFEAEINKSTSH